jgi:hypothetical protein
VTKLQLIQVFVFAFLALGTAVGTSDENWKEDQAAGNYWYVGRGGIYTHDPYDNNPGTMVVLPSPEKNEIRIYPDIPFPETGNTDVQYGFGTTPEEADSPIESWPITFEQGVFGYVEVPEELTTMFIDRANAEGYVVLNIADRQGNIATRTFVFEGYAEAYASLPDDVRIFPPPNENGLY